MNYSKPEMVVIGDANCMIRGDKDRLAESANLAQLQEPAFEMED